MRVGITALLLQLSLSPQLFSCFGLSTESNEFNDVLNMESDNTLRRHLRYQGSRTVQADAAATTELREIDNVQRLMATATEQRIASGSLFFNVFPYNVVPTPGHMAELTDKTNNWLYSLLHQAYGNLISAEITVEDFYSNRRAAAQVELDIHITAVFEPSSGGIAIPSNTEIRSKLDNEALASYVSDYLWHLNCTNPFWHTFGVSQRPFSRGQDNTQAELGASWATGGDVLIDGQFGFGFPSNYDPKTTPAGTDLDDMKAWLNDYIGSIIQRQYTTIFKKIETSIDTSSVAYNGGSTDTVTMEISFMITFDENSLVIPTRGNLYRLMATQDLRGFVKNYLWEDSIDDYWHQSTQMSWRR